MGGTMTTSLWYVRPLKEPAGRRRWFVCPAWVFAVAGGRLGLAKLARHVGLWRDVAGRIGVRELVCNQPAAVRGKGAVDLGCESQDAYVSALGSMPMGHLRLCNP
jgi:hypothetical protein